MSNSHNEHVEKTWDDFWKRKDQIDLEGANGSGRITGRLVHFFKKWEYDYNLDRWYKETLLKELSGKENICILEAGCGEGATASKIYSNNNKFYLLDIS